MLLLIGGVIIGIQLLYLIVLLIVFNNKKKLEVKSPRAVSVIVCAHDEEENLKELVPLLLKQQHPEFEVIIVEDRSNDGTFDYLLQATQEDNRLKMVRVVSKPENINGKKYGLTLGIRAAKYEWLLFTDADCRPASDQWLAQMTSHYNDQTQIVLGFSPYKKLPGLLNAFIRFESILTGIQYIGLALLGNPYMGVGRNLAYVKSMFLKSKGFNNYLGVMGGDDDLFVNQHAKKSNTQVCIGAHSTTVSNPKTSWGSFLNQKLRHLSAGKHYKFSDKLLLGCFMMSWIFIWFISFPLGFLIPLGWILVALFVLRWILLISLIRLASRRLDAEMEAWKIPLLDFIFPFYYLVTGLRALVVKRIKWKS